MRKRYQIAVLRKPLTADSKWELLAHGARYEPLEAFGVRDDYLAKGHGVRLMPLMLPEGRK